MWVFVLFLDIVIVKTLTFDFLCGIINGENNEITSLGG